MTVISVAPRLAAADEKGRQACFAASEQGQLRRNEGKLRAARQELVICASERCPAQMRRDCAKWLDEVDATIATVVLEAHDGSGKELTEVRVSIDGEALVERLDGKPVMVDPGEHTFKFVTDGRVVEEHQVIHAGDRARKLDAVFDGARPPAGGTAPATPSAPAVAAPRVHGEPPSPSQARSSASPVGYGLAGLAVAAGGIGATLAVIGLNHENALRRTCAPRCSERDTDILRHQYLAADILFGVAVVSTGAAIWWFVSGSSPRADSTFRVAPSFGVGSIALEGVF